MIKLIRNNRRNALAVAAFSALAGLAAIPGGIFGAGNAAAAESGIKVGPGLVLPPMDPVRGKALFASKECVVCHAINGFGGTDAPAISADTMAPEMSPFDFVAKMWNHSQGMIAMQMNELGHQIEFDDGQEIADIIAFLHDAEVQKTFTEDDIPASVREHMDSEDDDEDMGSMMKDGSMMDGSGSMMDSN